MVAGIAAHLGLVAAEVSDVAFASHQLQPDDVGGEPDRGLQVLRAEPRVADVVKVDHLGSPAEQINEGPAPVATRYISTTDPSSCGRILIGRGRYGNRRS